MNSEIIKGFPIFFNGKQMSNKKPSCATAVPPLLRPKRNLQINSLQLHGH